MMQRLLGVMSGIIIVSGGAIRADGPSPDVTTVPPYAEFHVVPLRVHVLKSDDLEDVNCGLTDTDISRVLGKVNGIWNKAGVHFGLESIVREEAADQDRFKLARGLAEGKAPSRLFRILRPGPSRDFEGLHVYFVHDFDVNGFYGGQGFAFVKETAKLREVEGGIDEPIPRVTAHELGHALGLSHRQDTTNLLASGTTGTRLNAAEVEKVREALKTLSGARSVHALREAAVTAESANDRERAHRLWSWLAEIPGDGAQEARNRLERLRP